MEKRSPKLPMLKEKVQSSCLWGLVDIFDFRNGRSNQKLLTNGRRRAQKEVSDFEHSRNVHTIASCPARSQGFEGGAGLAKHDADSFEESIKNLMKQKFGNSKKQKKTSKKQRKNSDFELVNQLQDIHKKPSKHSKEYDQIHIQQWKEKFLLGPEQPSCSAEISLDKHNLEAVCEGICREIYQGKIWGEDRERVTTPSRYNELDQVNVQLLQIAAAKAFIDQIYINRNHDHKDGMSSKSKYFSDALEILNLNTDLVLKLLQDQNSPLLSIQNLQFPLRDKERMKFYLDSRPSECGSGGTRNDQDAIKMQKKNSNNPLWKKLKYRYGCSSKENTTSLASNKIVILKPGSAIKRNPANVYCHCSSQQAHQGLKNKEQIIKSAYFFKEIKRKFKQAIGENQQKQHWISMDESLRRLARNKHLLKDVDKGKSSNSGKGKFTFSHDAKRREKQQKLVVLTTRNRSKTAPGGGTLYENFNSSYGSCSKQRQLDIFMEAKRHLSERLRKIDMGEIVPSKEAPRTLKMILSSPEHDFLTTPSPKRDGSAPIPAQMRFSPYYSLESEIGKEMDFPCPLQHIQELSPCDFRRRDDQLEISEFTPEISKKLQADPDVMENICSIKDDLVPNGSANIPKEDEVVSQKSSNTLAVPHELNSIENASSREGTETRKKYEENGYVESSHLAIPLENHPIKPSLGSSRPLTIRELEITDTAKSREEHASPVSVLEPFSPEYVNSPTSIMNESSLQPRCITFDDCSQVVLAEDPKIDSSACMDMEEPLHVYLKALMEASELSFNNEIYLKGPSPQNVLYTCIVDIMGLYPVESYNELELLFDFIHEVLIGIYESYFGYPPWLSFLRQKIRPVPLEKDMVDEVVKEVYPHLFQNTEPTLDQLMANDFAKTDSWLDLCLDTEDLLIQIAEDVLQDSIEDTILEVQI